MKCYLAPLEGITTYNYRNAHHTYFTGVDKYFTPFVAPGKNKLLTSREKNDVLPEHNQGMYVVPQILTNQAEDFLKTAKVLQDYGYEEINLNLGCPSGTVVAKGKGSGFLATPDELQSFLGEICMHYTGKLSIKARIGKDSPEEMEQLLTVFNQFPLEELILHPRIQKDFYRNSIHLAAFERATSISKNPVCYNGDLFSIHDYKNFSAHYGEELPVMLGRGVIANPGLIGAIKENTSLDKETLQAFHDTIYVGYEKIMSGERDVLFKMKELWFYMIHMFTNHEKYAKKIKKAQKGTDYLAAVSSLFHDQEIDQQAGFCPPGGKTTTFPPCGMV